MTKGTMRNRAGVSTMLCECASCLLRSAGAFGSTDEMSVIHIGRLCAAYSHLGFSTPHNSSVWYANKI